MTNRLEYLRNKGFSLTEKEWEEKNKLVLEEEHQFMLQTEHERRMAQAIHDDPTGQDLDDYLNEWE